jgi:hypothetical protein
MAKNPKYIMIPEEILMDQNLNPNEKFVLSNIRSVCTGTENNTYRFGNGWIANYLGVTRRSASSIVNSLIKKGYINSKIVYKSNSKEVDYRVLSYIETPPGRIYAYPVCQTSDVPQEVNFQDMNNTSNSNSMNKVINISFDEFYNLYGKKKGSPKKIEKKWKSLSNKNRQLIMDYLPKYKKEKPDPQFRKDPMTFLNNETWLHDEILEVITKPKSNSVDVISPILREIRRIGAYGKPTFRETELDAQRVVKQLGWGSLCSMTEFDLKMRVSKCMELTQ